MKLTPKESSELISIFRNEINLSPNAKIQYEKVLNNRYPIRADIKITDRKKVYLIDITHTATWERLSRLLLYHELSKNPSIVILAAKVIPESIYSAAAELNIRIIQLPHDISVSQTDVKPRGKITSEKAWKIITYMIKSGPCSIRSISQEQNVSYAWTHNTVKNLLSRGIVNKKGNLVEIGDVKGLLDAVAWERSLKDLQIDEIITSFDSTHELAKTLTRASEKWDKSIVFAAYISGTLQFGYGVRSDLVYCYVSSKDYAEILRNNYQNIRLVEGVKIIVLKADRDVFTNAEIIDGVKITSRSQTLLDVAGLGYSGRDLLNHMVEQYGTNSR